MRTMNEITHAPVLDPALTDPWRPARRGAWVVAGFIAFLVLWGLLAPVSTAAIATGRLQVEGKRQSVQHQYGGTLERILVKEGGRVEKGQDVFILSSTDAQAQLNVLQSEHDALKAADARLQAERMGMDEPKFNSGLLARLDERSVSEAIAGESTLMAARRRQYEAEKDVLARKAAQLKELLSGGKAQLEGLERRMALLEEEAQGARQLLASGYTPRARVRELEGNVAALEGQRGARLSEIARLQEAIGQAEIEIARLDETRLSGIADDLRTTRTKLAGLEPKLDAARDRLARTRVKAPASGQVVGLAVFTEGGVVKPGETLLDIVPDSGRLIVEAELPLSNVQDIRVGQAADIQLVGINARERPDLQGKVLTVAADQARNSAGQGYYPLRIELAAADVARLRTPLQAGMPAQVIITTQERSFADYILGPLIDEIRGSFREK
jgi:HlyD family secretion protein